MNKVLRILAGSLFISLSVTELTAGRITEKDTLADGFASVRPAERDTFVDGRRKRIYQTEKTANPPKIDGILNDFICIGPNPSCMGLGFASG